MIEYRSKDILRADVEALVNPVNCVGVMGKGLALEFKKIFQDNYIAYRKCYQEGKLYLGHPFVFKTNYLSNPKYIINFPTKYHWKDKSRLKDIKTGLYALERIIKELNITSIAVPALGCGLGGLDWNQVHALIEETANRFPEIYWIVYKPKEFTSEYLSKIGNN